MPKAHEVATELQQVVRRTIFRYIENTYRIPRTAHTCNHVSCYGVHENGKLLWLCKDCREFVDIDIHDFAVTSFALRLEH